MNDPVHRWVIIFLLLIMALAWNYAVGQMVQVASFYCNEGWCITTEAEVDRLEAMINRMQEKLKTPCYSI